MIIEAMNYSNPVTDSIRHDWQVNEAEYTGRPYSLFGGNVTNGRVTRNAQNLPAEAEYQYAVEVEGEEVSLPLGGGCFTRRTHSRELAEREFSRYREASLLEFVDGEYSRTVIESVDAPDHDENLLGGSR